MYVLSLDLDNNIFPENEREYRKKNNQLKASEILKAVVESDRKALHSKKTYEMKQKERYLKTSKKVFF